MNKNSLDFAKENFSFIVSSIMIIKMLIITVTTAESIILTCIICAHQVSRVIDYKFPRRPDIFTDVENIKNQIDEMSRDVVALKFGNFRK